MKDMGKLDDPIQLDYAAAEALRNLRWSKGVSVERCARSLNIGLPDFVAKDRGRRPFTALEFAAVALLLELDVEDLREHIGLGGEFRSVTEVNFLPQVVTPNQ